MSIALAKALEAVDLQADQTYHCTVKHLWVELRVRTAPPVIQPDPLREADVMIDPPRDLPLPRPRAEVHVRRGAMPLPDPPMPIAAAAPGSTPREALRRHVQQDRPSRAVPDGFADPTLGPTRSPTHA
ncbi:MAG: hypothetical protein GW892_01715 [Armatimonadetes bacterium]|nr:hypothetical protein [Armatimonadota bacterium]